MSHLIFPKSLAEDKMMQYYKDYTIGNYVYISKNNFIPEWYIREDFARIFFDVSMVEPIFPMKFCRRIWHKANNKSSLIVIDGKNQFWFCDDVCYRTYFAGPYETEVETIYLKPVCYNDISHYLIDYKGRLSEYVTTLVKNENDIINNTLDEMNGLIV